MRKLVTWLRQRLFAPVPLCAKCGQVPSVIEHESWDPGWPNMPVGKQPVDHWFVIREPE